MRYFQVLAYTYLMLLAYTYSSRIFQMIAFHDLYSRRPYVFGR